MSTRAYVRRRAQRQPVVDADVASEHPSIQPVSPSPAPTSSLPASPSLDGEERMTHDFSQIAVQPAPAPASPLAPQLKRRLSQPGYPHEQEADQVADAVTQMPEPESATMEGAAPTQTAQASASGGQPLDVATRAYMEPRFGHDFGHVRVHSDAEAAEAAAGYQARAYTLGGNIVFGAGEYAPDTAAGRHLLAHELTHVVQQQGASAVAASTVQREPVSTADLPSTPAVAEQAKGMAGAAMDDDVLAGGVIDLQLNILDGWDGALAIFDKVLTSKSDKEANTNFADAITKFAGETLLEEIGKLTEPLAGELKEFIPAPVGTTIKFVMAMNEEAKRAREAKESATLRDFYDTYKAAITSLRQNTRGLRAPFIQTVKNVLQGMVIAEDPGHKTGKMMTSNAAFVYSTMRENLVDAYAALSAQADASTTDQIFRKLSEEWIRTSEHRDVFGNESKALLEIFVNPDYTIKRAHVQGSGGQKIAEELLKDAQKAGLSGVDVFGLKVPKIVTVKFSEKDYPVWLRLDAENRDLTRSQGYPQNDADAEAIYRTLMSHGLAPTANIEGD